MQELGHFPYRVMRAIESLGDMATGRNIHHKLEEELKMKINPGQMYVTLDKLAGPKYIEARELLSPIRFKVTSDGQ